MATVGTSAARTRWSQLLGRVARGERILITHRGRPVAMLVPPEPEARGDIGAVVREMLATRDANGPTRGRGLTTRLLREDGRRC